jgi:NADH:ubiquinone oxidoreductase subunit C
VPRERHFEVATALRLLGYRLYGTVVATHFEATEPKKESDPAVPEHYEVLTMVRRPGPDTSAAAWRVRVGVDETIASLTRLYPGADWQEREQYDLVGVVFDGHPDLRRLMMPEDWEGHPLRKDYAIETGCPPWR